VKHKNQNSKEELDCENKRFTNPEKKEIIPNLRHDYSFYTFS
jgi:hypothetical protein